jgi:hypothetical protein
LILLIVAATFFWKLWLTPDGFLYRPNSEYSDLTITHWPNALFIREAVAEWGQIPWWRTLIFAGEPFAANPLSGLWYPPFWLLLISPLTFTFNLLFLLHAAWCGWGGYRLARSMGASPAGSAVAALTLMVTPKAIAHLASGHVGLYCAWAWMPWLIWAVRRLSERERAGDVAVAASLMALLALADVRMAFFGGLLAGTYWLFRSLSKEAILSSSEDGAPLRRLSLIIIQGGATALLTVALVGVQILPLAAVSERMNRGGLSLEESGIASLPPRYLLGLLIADHGGFQEWMTYIGAVGMLLALAGLFGWRARERWLWGGLALAAAVYSLGTYTPLYPFLYQILPPLSWLRGPARAWFLVVLGVALLAAQGVTRLEQARARRRMGRLAVALVGAALAGGVGGIVLRLPVNVVMAALVWPLAGVLIALRSADRLNPRRFSALILGLALLDLLIVGTTLYRLRPQESVLAEGEGAAAWLAGQPRPFRVYSPSYSIPQHTGAAYGIETVDGVDPFQLADFAAFMRAATGIDLPGYSVTVPAFPEMGRDGDILLAHRDVVPDLRLLGLLNVRYLAAAFPMDVEGLAPLGEQGGVHLYRNEHALPRAFVVERVTVVEDLEGALDWLAENDPAQAAAVEGGTPLDGEGQARLAHIVGWTANRIEIEAEGPGLLVLSEVYDPDWRAEVGGQAAEVVRVDGILRGVVMEEGTHPVVFAYHPAGLTVGAGLTAMGLLCAVALCFWGRDSRLGRMGQDGR